MPRHPKVNATTSIVQELNATASKSECRGMRSQSDVLSVECRGIGSVFEKVRVRL